MIRASAAAVVAVALLLAGCAAPVSPVASPSPSTATEEVPAPQGVAAWQITTSSVGPISLGDDRAAVTAMLDGFEISDSCPNPDALLSTDVETGSAVWLLFRSDRVDSVTVGGSLLGAVDGPIRTVEGIGTGSAEADVRSSYPDAVEIAEGYSPQLRVETSDGWLTFELDSEAGTVAAITVADQRGPAPEYCG